MTNEFDRRQFLKHTGLGGLAFSLNAGAWTIARGQKFGEAESAKTRAHLLALLNQERAQAGLNGLKLDPFACKIAEQHAVEMAENNFLSHWGLDGRKPYHRFALAGGTEATAENEAAADYTATFAEDDFLDAPLRLHKAMYEEIPPNDGHRQNILTPQHTHVGLGVATRGLHLRLCEVYVGRYLNIDPYPLTRPPLSRMVFSGQVLDPRYSITAIDVFFELPPTSPARSWLETARPYGLPENPTTLLMKLPANKVYDDGTTGSVEIAGPGRFRAPIELSRKEPGIYTLVVWLSRSKNEKPFPATNACVRAE